MHYYLQWQHLDIDPSTWQNNWTTEQTEPRKLFAEHITRDCDSILNVGCGVAAGTELYKANYHGVEVTPKFAAEAHKKGTAITLSSALKLPFRDNSFDCVCCENLLTHLPPAAWRGVLSEMFRVSSKLAATFEPVWKQENVYQIGETYNSKQGLLYFFNNRYDGGMFICFASLHNRGCKVETNLDEDYQFTYYRAEAT